MFEPIIINLDYSPREERHSEQTKSIGSRIGKRIGSGLVDRPNIGKNRRTIGSGRIDIPTGGARGYKKPTGSRLDIDRDGWADEGTTNPVWVGLSSGQDRSRPVIETQRARPKINLINQKINERKKIRQKIKYGENSLDGKLVSRKNGSKWLDGLSNEQISNILVPDSYQTYSKMLADGFGVDKGTIEKYLEFRWGAGKPWLEIDYSENSTKELRQALQSALDESPIFSWAVRNYGSPTYSVMTRKSAEAYNNRDAVKPLYDALKKMYPDAPGEPQFAASNHLDFEMVTFNPVNVVDKKSWQTSEPISTSFQTSKLPSDSDTVIDRSISGTILHEWAHWYHSEMLLANIESTESKKRSPKSLINPQDSDFIEKIKIALEYNSDNGNMNLHLTKKPLEDSPNEPRTITSYGHVSKKEMFAEGMLAYMHPNEQLKLKAINKKLRQDIETILVGDKGIDAWKDSKANIKREKNILSSGRKNRKLTKLSSGSKIEKTEKPKYPRHPSYGPFLDGADDVFADVKNWEEFKEVYDNLEINFFDYETTGLVSDKFQQSSSNGAPVQFGVTKTKGGKEVGRLNIFMNPGEELGDWSRKNLKNKDGEPLTDEWLSSQTSIADAHKKLIEFVGPDAIFGVQNAVFDKTVLEDALKSSGIEWRPKGWVDTKVVSDLVIPKWTKENQDAPWTTDKETGEKIPSNSLKALTEYLDINLGEKHHTADADAAATSELMSKIIDKAIEKNWSNDIFDKNWRDQKIKDKLENHQQKIIDFEQQKNNWISETSPKKSTVPKEIEEKEFGFGRLSSGTTSYKGRHESPDASSGAPLHNLANGAIYPEDIYGPNGANLYGGAFPDLAQKAVAIFRKLRNKPDSELTIYRAVPRGKNIKEGDWVTVLPEYAKIHGDSWLKDDYEIVTKKVKAKELFNEGNSLLEFGYHSKLSSGKYDGAPTYKGKVWKDRKNELDGPVWPFPHQAKQYPKDGPPGISYFKGVVNESTWVDCLLYRDDSGKLIGILNHYPFALVDPDDPRIVEKRGNFNIFIDPKHKGKGIGTKLVDEAVSRYNVDLRRQRYSEEGANFINNYIRKLPENKNKPKLSSGATEITPVERKEIADKQLSVKLSALDIEAIGNWNGYLFRDINDYLRNNNSGNQELAEGVVSAFERISVPVPADLVLWRGIRASQGEAKAYRVGDTLQDDGFQSATFKKRIATQFNSPRSINDEWEAVVFEINAKKGTKVVDIQSLVEKLDLASDAEDEILLQNGTQYKVTKIERNINQNEWAGIDDTSFKGEKITVITVDVIKNSDKDSRLSSGAAEPIKDIWVGDRYIRSQTYKNIGIGFTGQPRLRDVPSGKRFVQMEVIDSVDGKPKRVPRDKVRTFTEKTISAAIDWLLDRQIQTEGNLLNRRFILTEEQFKEFLAADIKAAKAKPDPNKKKYPSMKRSFRVDEKELASLSEDTPDNRMLVQVPNRFWDDHLSRSNDDSNSPEVRGQFRTETRLNYFELYDLISDASYYMDTAGLPGEEFDSMGAEQLMDALIKQGIPIENGKLKLSSGKTNRANRRANNSKLSSGAAEPIKDVWSIEEFKNMSDEKHARILSEAGLSQRGEAEDAGQVISEKGFVGLYQYALEHIGDLYHRAQHRLKYSAYGLDEVDEKITKILRYLRQPYGFEREVKEQIDGQPELSMDVLKSLGKKYADAHSKLPVYNLPAELMVKASMHLGNWEFEDAARTLEQLREMLNDEEKWKFMLSRQGTIEYLESKRETRSPFSKSPVSDDAIKLTKAEQKILKEIKESGTPDFAKVVHAVALDYDEPGSILDNMKPTNMRVTMKNARTVSSEIQRQAQESLERAGFPEEFSVWRTAGAGGRPNTGVVSVTTRKGGLGLFKGTVVEYRVSRSDVLTHGEGFLGNLQTYAEDELHVDIEKLRPVGSKLSSGKTNRTNRRADNSRLSSGKSSVLNDEEKKQISDILKKEFPGGISSAVGKMADYSGSRLQNNRDGQVSLNPQEKKAIEALENIGKIIDKRISESVSEKRDAGSLGESPEMQLLLEKEKAIDAANIYLRKIYRSTEDALDKIKKLDKQVRKSIVSNIYKIPKKTSNIDKEYSEHNNKISGSYLVQLLKDVRQNLTAGEYRAAENFTLPVRKIVDSSGREIMPRKIINFNYSNTYKNANNLHLTDLVSEIDMEFLELPENQPIINDITLTLNLADKISKNLIKKTEKEARKISELSDAEILDFIEKEIYVNVESFGSKTGSMKYRRNILTGRAFTMGPEVVSKELPEFDSESSLRALNEKSAKDLLIKTLREIFTDNEVIQTSDKSFKARQNTTIELDEKLAKGIAPQYVAPSSLSVEEAIRFYGDKAGLISKETRELNKQRESYVEQGLVPKMQYGVENEFEKQTAKLKRELFVQALGELGIAFTKPENVRKTVVRLYMQRLNDFYQWTKGLGLKEGEDGKNRPDETIDFNKNNPYEYVGGEKDGRHAATIPLMNKVLSLIPENLTNGSLVVELPAEEAERLTRLGASETFGYLGKHKIISKYFADAWVNPLERGGSKLSIIWRLVPGKNRAHAHNILNGKVLITQEPAPTSGPTDEWESVALHEIVHGVEYANPVVTALEWMYWVSRRKAGEALTTLRRKDGTEYRNKNEKGVVDEWGESYAGKIYEGRPFDALEIFTTGMQSIFYENTSKNADPSHRAFTIGVLVAAGNGKPQ